LLILLRASDLLACSCAGPASPEEQFASADVVFRGTVTAKVDRLSLFRKAWITLQALVGHDPDFDMDTYMNSQGFKVKFSVREMWRGPGERTLQLYTGRGGGDCGVPFQVGTEYLVYAWCDGDGDCFTIICGRTRRIENAAADLRYLASRRALPLRSN
jgi:hypothetical protein